MTKETGSLHITLDAFQPRRGPQVVKQSIKEAGLVPDNLAVKALIVAAQRKPEIFRTELGEKLEDDANKAIYAKMAEQFGLTDADERPDKFYASHVRRVRDGYTDLVNTLAPEEKNRIGLREGTKFALTPADAIKILYSPRSSERAKYEIARQLALTGISMQIAKNSQLTESRLGKVMEAFDSYLFTGDEEIVETEARHDDETLEVVSIGDTIMPGRDSIDPNTSHTKHHQQFWRSVSKVGHVKIEGRIKEAQGAPVLKAVKKAIHRRDEDPTIRPEDDVRDIMGIQLVVEDELTSKDSTKVDDLKDKIEEVLKDNFKIKSVTPKKATNGAEEKSPHYHAKVWEVAFEDMDSPLEIRIQGLKEALDSEYEYGEWPDDDKGQKRFCRPTGAAHGLMEIQRGIIVLKELCPPFVEPSEDGETPKELYGPIDWEEIKHRRYEAFKQDRLTANVAKNPGAKDQNTETPNPESTPSKDSQEVDLYVRVPAGAA